MKSRTATNTRPSLVRNPLFLESRKLAREVNVILEAQSRQLKPDEIHNLFTAIQQGMTDAGKNKTLIGKGADAIQAVGAKIAGLGRSLRDTTVVQGVDDTWADIKSKLSASLEKSPQGSTVLRSIDKYQQLVKKYPQTSKFFWNAAAVVGGLASGGLATPALIAAVKGIDSLVQGKEFSAAVGDAAGQFGKTAGVMGAKNLAIGTAHAAQAAAQGVTDAAHNAANAASNAIHNVTGGGATPTGTEGGATVAPTGTEGGGTVPPTGAEGAATGSQAYTTVAGDQLGKIAQAHNTTTQAIIDANPNVAAALKAAANGKDMPVGLQMNIPSGSAPAGTNPFAGNTHFNLKETAQAIAALGFVVTKLPMNEMVDKESTVRRWALNESLGRARTKSVQLTESGIDVVLYNIGKLKEAAEQQRVDPTLDDLSTAIDDLSTTPAANQQGGTVRARPANGNDAAAQAKNANPANTSTTAGPQGKLPGGPAPTGNVMPHLAADPEGKYDTKHKGGVGNKFMDKVEGGLKQAGNWLSDKFKSATTKFDANRAKRRLADAGLTDSNEIAQWLITNQKVPADIVTAIYAQLGFPAPDSAAAGVNKNQPIRGLGGGVDMRQYAADQTGAEAGAEGAAATGAEGAAAQASGAAAGGGAASIAAQAGGNKQEQKAARDIDQEIDDLIRSLRRVDNLHQPAYVKYIRDALDRTFGKAEAAAPAAKQYPGVQTGQTAAQVGQGAPAAPAAAPAPKTGTLGERRRSKSRYIREAKHKKLAAQFEDFVSSKG